MPFFISSVMYSYAQCPVISPTAGTTTTGSSTTLVGVGVTLVVGVGVIVAVAVAVAVAVVVDSPGITEPPPLPLVLPPLVLPL
jgi:hypothetical protein